MPSAKEHPPGRLTPPPQEYRCAVRIKAPGSTASRGLTVQCVYRAVEPGPYCGRHGKLARAQSEVRP